MRIGTKSLLFGAHQFLFHPLFVAIAWWKLYGFPFDPRLWIAFFIHDLGYWGKPNMDGPEGDKHPEFAARIMGFLFGASWRDFCLYHSRFYAKRDGKQYSKLCVADKLALSIDPWWFYLPRVLLTGEIHEYMEKSGCKEGAKFADVPDDKYTSMRLDTDTYLGWYNGMTLYLGQWVNEHKDLKPDTWTPNHINN